MMTFTVPVHNACDKNCNHGAGDNKNRSEGKDRVEDHDACDGNCNPEIHEKKDTGDTVSNFSAQEAVDA